MPLLQKDFVLVKLDTERYSGAQARLDELCPKPGGIPWFVVLDPEQRAQTSLDGELHSMSLGDANLMDGGSNIGSPYTHKEIRAFLGFLKATNRKLTTKDLVVLERSLLAQGEQASEK